MMVETLTEDVACQWLFRAAKGVSPYSSIVEVGVYRGGSLKYLAKGAQAGNGAPVYGIDPWGSPGAYPNRPHMLNRYVPGDQDIAAKAAPTAHLIHGFSVTEASRWSHSSIGLLYIDAVHREHDVLEDFYAWEPHLAPEAIVAFDDHDERFDGVRRAVARLVREGRLAPIELIGNRLAVTTANHWG